MFEHVCKFHISHTIWGIILWSSLIYNTTAKHERHECDTNATQLRHERHEWDTSATPVLNERHDCDTSATRMRHECYTNDTIATQVKNFDFDNNTSKNIFSHPYVYYMATVYYTFLGTNWNFLYFLCHCFVFLHNSIRISIPWLFRKSSKSNFCRHYNIGFSTILIKSLKVRNNCRVPVTSPSNLLWKLWIWVFWILCFVIIFL